MTPIRPRIVLAVLVGAVSIGGCGNPALLPDGQLTTISSNGQHIRASLQLTLSGSPGSWSYRPVQSCMFEQLESLPGMGVKRQQVTVSLRPVQDRLLVVATLIQPASVTPVVSTYLIDGQGRIYDRNVVDSTTHERVTSENWGGYLDSRLAQAKAANRSNLQVGNINVVDDFSIVVPLYEKAPGRPGDVVAQIRTADGATWAEFTYRGDTTYRGQNAKVFDLTRRLPGSPSKEPYVVGFSIVSTETMLPLLLVLEPRSKYWFEQVSCVP